MAQTHPWFWYSLQCIKESVRAETGPSAISAMDVLTSREPFALVGPSIWVVTICEGSPSATDDVAHMPRRLKWIDGFDEPGLKGVSTPQSKHLVLKYVCRNHDVTQTVTYTWHINCQMSLFYALLTVTSTNKTCNSKSPVQRLQPIAEDKGQLRAMEIAQANPLGQAITEVKDIKKGWKT